MSADADITINKRVAINKFKKHINQISYEHQEVFVLNETQLIQYFSYALSAIGNLAFIVSMITQVIKEMPVIKKIQTNVVVLVTALILCPVSVLIACQYFNIAITWYYLLASIIAAFLVYLVSTGGWERVHEMWNRTKYKSK